MGGVITVEPVQSLLKLSDMDPVKKAVFERREYGKKIVLDSGCPWLPAQFIMLSRQLWEKVSLIWFWFMPVDKKAAYRCTTRGMQNYLFTRSGPAGHVAGLAIYMGKGSVQKAATWPKEEKKIHLANVQQGNIGPWNQKKKKKFYRR